MKTNKLYLLSFVFLLNLTFNAQAGSPTDAELDRQKIEALTASAKGITRLAAEKTCDVNQFKSLYLKLQNDLNYNGRDAFFEEAKKKISLKEHEGNTYNGVVFEDALLTQYSNAIKKVGLLFQNYKYDKAFEEEIKKSNPELVDFFKSIEPNGKNELPNKLSSYIDSLVKISATKFSSDKNKILSKQDIYLIKKLMVHSNDHICRVLALEDGKVKDPKKIKDYQAIANQPINQLLDALRASNITEKTDFKINQAEAINQAIKDDLKNLRDWIQSKNSLCKKYFANIFEFDNFNRLQQCNYKKFINSLLVNDENFNDIESVLHFINANSQRNPKDIKQKDGTYKTIFLVNPAAETYLDNKKFQSTIKLTIGELKGDIGRRNDPPVPPVPPITLNTDKTLEQCQKEGKDKKPEEDLIPSPDKKTCVKKEIAQSSDKTLEQCQKEGKAKKPEEDLIPSPDKKSCVKKEIAQSPDKTLEQCQKEGKDKKPEEDLVPSPDKKSCVKKDIAQSSEKTLEQCQKEGKDKKPEEDLVPSPDKKSCVKKDIAQSSDKTLEQCQKEGKDKNPEEDLVPSEDKKSCVKKPAENKSEAQKECDENNKKITKESGTDTISLRWKVKDGKCIDSQDKDSKGSSKGKADADEPEDPFKSFLNGLNGANQVPARFVPTQIPQRNTYILPGMP